ncbi:M57 family metalloprotease [Flavobacteriaceae bacterium 3-367]|uniref:M57 family metalloprotease n=1 Tax=Eudoraea algarum TaxID=3417568 RepID=UPI00327A7B91
MVVAVLSCAKDEVSSEGHIPEASEEVLDKIRNLGYSTENVKIINTQENGIGYVVEGDFILHERDLNLDPEEGVTLRIAEVEQYRTTLIPNFRRRSRRGNSHTTLDVAVDDALPVAYYNATRRVATRYNSLGLSFRLNVFLLSQRQRRTVEITVREGSAFAAAGPPFERTVGRRTTIVPYNEVLVNPTAINSNNQNHLTTIIAHEIGHCIGFRHTDFMNRSFSDCRITGNEGQGAAGAIPIPGTPTDPEARSWMLACIGANENRPFTNNDVVALRFLHSL